MGFLDTLLTDAKLTLAGVAEVVDNTLINFRTRFSKPSPGTVPFSASIKGKTVLITGGTAGIGNATAEMLALAGAKEVIVTGRSAARAQAAAASIQSAAQAAGAACKVSGLALDLASVKDVKRFSKSLQGSHPELDVLICNAGIMTPPDRVITEDGMELQFQTNHLGHFALAVELGAQHVKRQSAQSASDTPRELRIVMVTSMASFGGQIDFDDLTASARYKPFKSYAQSKLANIMAAVELQRRFRRAQPRLAAGAPPAATAVAVHPGLVDTELARNYFETDYLARWLQPVGRPVLRLLFPYVLIPPKTSARCLLWAAFAPAEVVAGEYVADSKVQRKPAAADDAGQRERLWDVSCQLANMSNSLL